MRAARSLHLKKHRYEQRCFLVEGPTAIQAALDAPAVTLERIFVDSRVSLPAAIAAKAASQHVEVTAVDDRTMHSLSETRTPQGVVAVARFFDQEPSRLVEIIGDQGEACIILVLHDVADPGNAGTLMRSAEAFGAKAVCCGSAGVDPYNEKVARASLGSMFHLPLICYDEWSKLHDALVVAKVSLVAAEAFAPDVRAVTLPQRVALLVGNERHGVAGV
ncbi:MAG TPA: RNA methyltransferase, partial [Candidatus Eremiobacteraceae bacterium]|nr:RNA methyltransferase [Candidatus Eremiobacteraceae bacterium]